MSRCTLGDSAIDNYGREWSPEDDSASSIQSTLWSVILRTRNPKDPNRIAALVQLYSAYSLALYAYARARLPQRADAEAAVRGFLDYIRKQGLGFGSAAHRDRLRAFLLDAFQDYLSADPGRGVRPRATKYWEFDAAEAWFAAEPVGDRTPESTFHRAWARCVLVQSCAALEEEIRSGYGDLAAQVIVTEVSPHVRRPYDSELAAKLDLSPDDVLELLRSSRRRLRELIMNTIRETVSSTPDVEVEFWDLFKSV